MPKHGSIRRQPSAAEMKPAFRSSIPSGARPRIVLRHPNGGRARVEYSVGKTVVGYREFDDDGALMVDCGLRSGRPHGTMYRIDPPGKLLSATPYKNGLEHGLARQWSDAGQLVGSYRMRNGTGIDLWWLETWTRPRRQYLAEVHFMLKGCPHGYEWWVNENQRSVWQERHWSNGELHGIERKWDMKGRLERGFPKFYVRGRRVTRQSYERALLKDSSLPVFRPEDEKPERKFPPAVARHLNPPAGSRRKKR